MNRSYILFVLLMMPCHLWATDVDIFPTGQGNTVMVRYGQQAIIIDAGSSESKFRALYHAKSVKEEERFSLQPPVQEEGGGFAGATSRRRKGRDSHDDASTESPSGSSTEGKETGARRRKHERIRTQYMQETLEDIRKSFPRDGEGNFFLKAVVVSHADKDHYSLISDIFDASQKYRINSLILSGFSEDYKEEFQTWLAASRSSIRQIIFTGMYDGSERKDMAEGIGGYARAYSSGMPNPTETEQHIEAALQFTPEEGEHAVPLWQILSMNAGHATEPNGIVRIANGDKNTNSLVLRLQAPGGRSFVFAGDAEEGTWEHIRANFWRREQELASNYFLISHHGSKEEGATRPDILGFLKANAYFLSVGRHSKYHHPHQDTMNTLLSSPSLFQTRPHMVSYFGPRGKELIHKRQNLTAAIFSTLNHGKLSVMLEEEEPTIRTSSYKNTIYETAGDSSQHFSVDYDNVYCVVQGQNMGDALTELTAYFQTQGVRGIFWGKTAPKSYQMRPREPIMPAVESCQERDVLVNEAKNRFYFLEKIEEGAERRMRARQGEE